MAPQMVPGGINYSAVDSPRGLLLGGTTYSMTVQERKLCTQQLKHTLKSIIHYNTYHPPLP